MERGKSKKPPGSGIARNRAAKNGRTCPSFIIHYDMIAVVTNIVYLYAVRQSYMSKPRLLHEHRPRFTLCICAISITCYGIMFMYSHCTGDGGGMWNQTRGVTQFHLAVSRIMLS